MLKIDMHSHILPPDWPNLAEKYGDARFPVMVNAEGHHRIYRGNKFFREVWQNAFDAEFRKDECAKLGVDVQVISTVPVLFSYWAKPNQARELHRHRIIEPKLPAQSRNRFGVGTLTDHLLHRIARRDVQQQEDDNEHTRQRRDGQQNSAEEETGQERLGAGCSCCRRARTGAARPVAPVILR